MGEIHKRLVIYRTGNDKRPFIKWIGSLKDSKVRGIIKNRLDRLENGVYGDCEPVGEGVKELRIHFGPGYRIYFGEDEATIVVILCGGPKSSQRKDIVAAKSYWADYKERKKQ